MEIAGYASGYDNRTSLILFRHPGVNTLVQCGIRHPLRRDARSAHNRQLLRAAGRLWGHAPRKCRTAIQLQSPHASMGKPSPHGALGIDGGAPAPPLELPPPEPPLDAELLVPLPVVVLGDAPVSLQYVGSWVQI